MTPGERQYDLELAESMRMAMRTAGGLAAVAGLGILAGVV